MSGCCGPSCCPTAARDEYPYGPASHTCGALSTPPGEIPVIETTLTGSDRLQGWRVRFGIRRDHYRVRPGLYAAGRPDRSAPVLVTANYKLSFDAVRKEVAGRSVWLLVLDTLGINVWCAAGKGTFGSEELVRRVRETNLSQVVGHRTLVLPQLAAPGVAAHEVRALTGFRVVYGPVRAADIGAFLDDGMRATAEMRRVRFGVADRLAVTGVELSILRDGRVLGGIALLLLGATLGALPWTAVLLTLGAGLAAVLAGTLVVPILLPWIPGRAFALKGAIVGAAVALGILVSVGDAADPAGRVALLLVVTSIASFTAMNYTGSSTFTSLSGVIREMRRAVPLQVAATIAAVFALVISIVW